MSDKTDKTEAQKRNEEDQAALDKRNKGVGPGGQMTRVLADSERHQNPDLAAEGIYQPADRVANAPQVDPKAAENQEEHRKNLATIPPVPSESAGAASQAK